MVPHVCLICQQEVLTPANMPEAPLPWGCLPSIPSLRRVAIPRPQESLGGEMAGVRVATCHQLFLERREISATRPKMRTEPELLTG